MAKSFLVKSSEFLKKCCDGNWQETTTKTIKLEDIDSELFSAYLQWIYTGELVVCDEQDHLEAAAANAVNNEPIYSKYTHKLVEFAILSDRLLDSSFGNTIVDWFIKTTKEYNKVPAALRLQKLYQAIPGAPRFKRLLVDSYIDLPMYELEEVRGRLPIDFVFDLMVRSTEDRRLGIKGKRGTWQSRCEYHVHEEGASRCS